MYWELLPFAKECGVKIATENMWGWDDTLDQSSFAACATSESFLEHLELVNDDHFVACLDLGHAEMRGSGSGAANMIRALGHHLQALHIHDNDQWKDSHMPPFTMNIDFAEIVKALKEINYTGDLTLEADAYLPKYYNNAENIFEGIQNMADSAKRLAGMF
jgi:sugar phosphate isomerase/epimerase